MYADKQRTATIGLIAETAAKLRIHRIKRDVVISMLSTLFSVHDARGEQ